VSSEVTLYRNGDLIYVENDDHGVLVYYVQPNGKVILLASPADTESG